ncbi:hypothetical protein MKW94_029782 [Papaver nudicaule]|uniref:Neprosin PEP catalytic domain-containing protein n=1 Tax=Papaver nudicaule TaxID=74823 RepID=A0AA41VV43_PAPNU|nr:hypothetical protein [Papaver nudicaule]
MSFKDLIKLVAVVIVLFSWSPKNCYGAGGAKNRPSKEEDLELENQLKILNKPPVKSIRTKFGDIYDCINIYKQPAFDHPLLKNHKIQMKPNLVLQEERNNGFTSGRFWSSDAEKSERKFHNQRCPTGTVPIRRTKKEELVNAKHYSNWGISHHSVSAQLSDKKSYYGASAKMNTRNPLIDHNDPNKFSTAQIWIQNGPTEEVNSIEFGWAVFPGLFGDNLTRVFGLWTADGLKKTGCYNMLCPGFMQIDPMYSFGEVLSVADYGETPKYMHFRVHRDPVTGNWWLFDGPDHAPLGYWPTQILPHLASNVSVIKYGGIAGGRIPSKPTPPLGNGKLPNPYLDFGYSCHMLTMKTINDKGKSEDVDATKLLLKGDTASSCYDIKLPAYASSYWGTVIFFGGPGGICR